MNNNQLQYNVEIQMTKKRKTQSALLTKQMISMLAAFIRGFLVAAVTQYLMFFWSYTRIMNYKVSNVLNVKRVQSREQGILDPQQMRG
jgi:hypothetical protein